jgi:copper chaperone CopZ
MRTTLTIDGMRCAGCADNVERALKRIDGVEDVQVSLEQKRAIITHTSQIGAAALAKVVTDIGYKAAAAPNATLP